MKKWIMGLLMAMLCIALAGCGAKSSSGDTEPETNKPEDTDMVEVTTNIYSIWQLLQGDTDEFITLEPGHGSEINAFVENNFDGKVESTKAEGTWITFTATEAQSKELVTLLEKKVENGVSVVKEEKPDVTGIEEGVNEQAFTLTYTMDPEISLSNDANMMGLLGQWQSVLSYSWLVQLKTSLEMGETIGLDCIFMNEKSGHLITEAVFEPNGDDGFSINDCIIRRSNYDDYASSTTANCTFLGYVMSGSREYAEFKANDDYFFQADGIVYVLGEKVREKRDPSPGETVAITFGTECETSTLVTEGLDEGTIIKDEYVTNVE